MALSPEYEKTAVALHEALLTVPATKADCATHMINTGGMTLTQAKVEGAIDAMISQMVSNLVLSTGDYATLLAKHQAATPSAALRVLMDTQQIALLRREKDYNEQLIADATTEWTGLSGPQRAAIASLKELADEGLNVLQARIDQLIPILDALDA